MGGIRASCQGLLSYLQRLPGFSRLPKAAPSAPEPCLQSPSSSLSELSRLMGSRCLKPAWLLCIHMRHLHHAKAQRLLADVWT